MRNVVKHDLVELGRSLLRGWFTLPLLVLLAPLLAAAFYGWLHIPDAYQWQLALSALVALLMIAVADVALVFSMQRLVCVGQPPPLWSRALLLLPCVALWAAWDWALGRLSPREQLWAYYLGSRPSAFWRVYINQTSIGRGFTALHVVLAVLVAAAITLFAVELTTQTLRTLRWRRLGGALLRASWWLAVVVAWLLLRAGCRQFVNYAPTGTRQHQMLVAAAHGLLYVLLPVLAFVLLAAWAGVQLARPRTPETEPAAETA